MKETQRLAKTVAYVLEKSNLALYRRELNPLDPKAKFWARGWLRMMDRVAEECKKTWKKNEAQS